MECDRIFFCSRSIELLITNRFEGKSWPNGALCANLHWLETVLLPKIKHWAESISLPVDNGQLEKSSKVESLSLVSVEKYNKVYNELKQKYGPPLIQVSLGEINICGAEVVCVQSSYSVKVHTMTKILPMIAVVV